MGVHGILVVSLLWASLLLSIASTSVAYADDHSGPTSSPSIQPETSATTPSGFATGQASLAYDAGTATGEVLSVIRHSDGTVTYAFATLAPAGAAQVLAANGRFTPQDVPAAITEGQVSVVPNVIPGSGGGCDWGTATGWINPNTNTCPPLHWERFNTTVAYWYVEDHTGAAWPVTASQNKWNQSPYVGAYYTTKCSSSFHCVPAHEGHYTFSCGGVSSSRWTGCTFVTPENNSTNHIASAYIDYNDNISLTTGEHRQVTCQEQGHTMGMGHNSSTDSCMYQYTSTSASTTPDSYDYGELQYQIYNH